MSKNPLKVDEYGLMQAISYAAQSPWLRHQTIKENILFGSLYEEERYKDVVECCALSPDLDMLEDGDETEIGARWVLLCVFSRAMGLICVFFSLGVSACQVDKRHGWHLLGRCMRERNMCYLTIH